MMKRSLILILLLTNFIFISTTFANITKKENVQQFINSMSKNYGFNKQKLEKIFSQVSFNKKIISTMNKPYESKPWTEYRPLFISQQRITEGVTYWQQHQKTLERAEKKFGVPVDIIVAIVGIESSYGKFKGQYKVIDSLSTLAFDYPRREKYFKSELKEFLLLTRENKLNPFSIYGSYAGAIGQPQFMPSSYRRHAIDFANNGKIDLSNNTQDVIGSIAKYLYSYGWKTNQPIAIPGKITSQKFKSLLEKNATPKMSIKQFKKYGISPTQPINTLKQASLADFKVGNNNQYWLLLHNFNVIKRYNPSNSYAMAVMQLGEAIAKERKQMLSTHYAKNE